MRQEAEKIKDEIIRLRRDIHAHPELGFEEFRTAGLVADTLSEIGADEIQTKVGRTGVTAIIGPGTGPTIGIRADMDALPIFEEVEYDYKSTNPGVMHACGHDAHTAMLLGAAHLLRQSFVKDGAKWKGNVKFLFQPSEEKWGDDGHSGATAMIADDAMDGVDYVIATHVGSTGDTGVCTFQDGPALAAPDIWDAKIYATGGHGAYPHRGTDPIFMLRAVLNHIYAIRSRIIDPLDKSVVSVGSIHTGQAGNVIPAEISLNGTIRSFDQTVREKLWAETEMAFKLVETMGGSYEFNLSEGYIPMVNSAQVNGWMRQVTADLYGQEAIHEGPIGMAGEDFAFMVDKVPGAMFSLGAKIGEGTGHHTPLFDIDENVLSQGTAILAETARRFVMGEVQ